MLVSQTMRMMWLPAQGLDGRAPQCSALRVQVSTLAGTILIRLGRSQLEGHGLVDPQTFQCLEHNLKLNFKRGKLTLGGGKRETSSKLSAESRAADEAAQCSTKVNNRDSRMRKIQGCHQSSGNDG